MHIPDGYLSPSTGGLFYVIMLPIWTAASNIVKRTLKAKQVPLMAIGAAFSFVIMMFNVPIPGGSTGHAIGGALLAILFGPWAATICISVALVVQALLFGDGGITAIGANCFNMAFVLPFTAYYIYKALSYRSSADSWWRPVASGIAGYIGINLAALCAGTEFGVQPMLFHTAAGQALYCPYSLNVAVPAMLGGHMMIFGWVEAIVTGLVVAYLQKQNPEMLKEGSR